MEQIKLVQLDQEKLLDSIAEIINKKIEQSLSKLQKKDIEGDDQFEFLTRKETAELLKVTYNSLHRWVQDGILKSYKIGNRTYFKREEILESLNSSQKKTA